MSRPTVDILAAVALLCAGYAAGRNTARPSPGYEAAIRALDATIAAQRETLQALRAAFPQAGPRAWNPAASYAVGDVVTYEGREWVCLANEKAGSLPPSALAGVRWAEFWQGEQTRPGAKP